MRSLQANKLHIYLFESNHHSKKFVREFKLVPFFFFIIAAMILPDYLFNQWVPISEIILASTNQLSFFNALGAG